MHKFHRCELWGFYGVDDDDLGILGYYADKQGTDSWHFETLGINNLASQHNEPEDTNPLVLDSAT
jgi:hypothetical protein